MEKEYVLITGATGFIGSHVVETILSKKSYCVVAIVRRIKNYKNTEDLENKGVILVEGIFYDAKLLKDIFEQYPIQYVIHIAALRGGGVGTKSDYYEVNVHGTEVILRESFKNRVKKVIYFSSVGVFGTIPKDLPAGLMTELNGDNAYHNSKILAEEKVKKFIDQGLNGYIIRPTITYGKGDNGFPMTLMNLVRKRFLFLPFGDIRIHLLNVNNLADLLIKMLKSEDVKERVFIAADETPIRLRDLANLIHNHFYNSNYPVLLVMPNFIFNVLLMIFRLIRNEKWMPRILLISRSWFFEINPTVNTFHWLPARTADSFLKSMGV